MGHSKSNRRRSLKKKLWSKQAKVNGKYSSEVKCYWCETMLGYRQATIDHEPALAEGGCWLSAVIACYPCNQRRSRETSDRIQAKLKISLVPE